MTPNKSILCINVDIESTNLGCAALGLSFIDMIQEIAKQENVHFDINIIGYGKGKGENYSNSYIEVHDPFCFDVLNYKFWKKTSLLISKADMIIDFTGGDSFTDLYGFKRFIRESVVKKYAIAKGKCFVFGPQTIGPFNNKLVRNIAKYLMRKSDFIFARDEVSNNYARSLGCDSILTTDVAFILHPTANYYSGLGETKKTKVGINVSGLMVNGGYNNNNQFGMKMDYKKFVNILVSECLKLDYEVHLIPHVLPLHSLAEDDYKALEELHDIYPRTILAPRFSSPKEAKEYVSYMDFFVGSRMHATIGAFSMGVPTIPVAYSPKFSRLFSSVGYNRVIDGKNTSEEKAIYIILDSIVHRDEIKEEMSVPLEVIRTRNEDFVKRIRDILDN